MDARMNPVAIAVMLGILVAWAGLLAAALYLGNPLLLAIFAVALAVALFFHFGIDYGPWAHLEPAVADKLDFRPARAIGAYLAYQADLMQMLELWTTGAGSSLREGTYEPLYLVLAVGAIGYLFADRFTVVGMGEDVATNLGVKYRSVLYVGLVVVSMMAALVVVVVGAIPFLGLIVPNIVSMMLGDNVRRVLPISLQNMSIARSVIAACLSMTNAVSVA